MNNISSKLQRTKNLLEEVQNCDTEDCPYRMTEQDHRDEEMMLIGRRNALEEVLEDSNTTNGENK